MPKNRIIQGPNPDITNPYDQKALKTFNDAVSLPSRALNYATYVIYDVPDNDGSIDDHIAVSAFMLRNAMVRCDAICELLKIGSANSSGIVFRALLETVLTALYLYKDESEIEFKTLAYRYCHLQQFIKNANQIIQDASISRQEAEKLEVQVCEAKSSCNRPEFQQVDILYKEYKKQNRRAPNWYSFRGGPGNLADLADKIGQGEFYHAYRHHSLQTHSVDGLAGARVTSSGRSIFTPLRWAEDVLYIANTTCLLMLMITKRFIEVVCPEQKINFLKWFDIQMAKSIEKMPVGQIKIRIDLVE